jgi:DNA-binding response OmpR family regulator
MLIVDDSSELCSILLLTFSYESFEILQAEKGLQKDKGDTSVN